MKHLLLNLMTAVGRSQIDYKTQLSSSVIDVLSFESTFLSFVCPCKSFVQIKTAIDDARSKD